MTSCRDRLAGAPWTRPVGKILHRFQREGVDGLVRKHTGRPLGVTPTWLVELQRVIDLDPHTVGVDSAVWTTRR